MLPPKFPGFFPKWKAPRISYFSLFDPLFGILEHATCTQTDKKDILQLVKTSSSRRVGERTRERGCIINNIIISSPSSLLLFALLHYSKKVYSYISFGPIFEGNDETIGIIGITGHVHLYKFLFSSKKIIFYNFILDISSSRKESCLFQVIKFVSSSTFFLL